MPKVRNDEISIHAAREGGDASVPVCVNGQYAISIHAAREGGDGQPPASGANPSRFQSTPPVKAATTKAQHEVESKKFQSTPPVKAATNCAYGQTL